MLPHDDAQNSNPCDLARIQRRLAFPFRRRFQKTRYMMRVFCGLSRRSGLALSPATNDEFGLIFIASKSLPCGGAQRAIDKTALWKKKKVAPILDGLHLQYMRI